MAPKQATRLRVVTLANAKGGVGKSTLASALAVRAAEESRRVALLDLDPQESLASWWTRRGKVKNPKLFEVDATAEAIELLVSEGWQWVFIDTGPARIELIEPGIAVADLVLIPTRPSALDIEQAAISVELCETHGKLHAFVLNHGPAGMKLTKSSIQFLKQNGSTVIDAPITFRPAYMRSTQPVPKRLQLNLKVLPEFHERVSALALNEKIPMVVLIERAVEAYARAKEGR